MAANHDLVTTVGAANAVIVGLKQESDIEEMYACNPMLVAGMEATRGWAFCHPPKVTWPALDKVADKDFEYVLEASTQFLCTPAIDCH
jgi:hypothetical protein